MSMFPELFHSADVFRDRFEQGLIDLLRTTGELGEDILVLANANFEPRIWDHLRDELRTCFARLAAELAAADAGGQHRWPARPTTWRRCARFSPMASTPCARPSCVAPGPWELQFNPLRAFRPARHSAARIEGIRAPFDAGRFHFDKPFLRQEIIWRGRAPRPRCHALLQQVPLRRLPRPAGPRPGRAPAAVPRGGGLRIPVGSRP